MAKQRKQGSGNGGSSNNGRGQNNDDNDDDGDGDEPGDDGFTDAQRESLGRIVNAAVSGQLGRKLRSSISSAVAEAMQAARAEQDQGGGRRRTRDDDDTDDDEGDDDQPPQQQRGKSKGKSSARDAEIEGMKRRVAQMEAERKAEREQAIARERDATLREHLTRIGVEPNRMRGALAVVGGMIKRDDKTGSFSYTAKRDGYDEDLDLDIGIKEWAGTDEGKSYLAPQGNGQQRQGSGMPRLGSGGGARPNGGGTAPNKDKNAAKAEAKQQAMQTLTQSIQELGGATINVG